ncbi:MAG: hypothetical protein NXI16_00120 [Alphaproteobacteria bacterium]|nr:hypothetical protein [Alphaproteobacteria bacterium]
MGFLGLAHRRLHEGERRHAPGGLPGLTRDLELAAHQIGEILIVRHRRQLVLPQIQQPIGELFV